MIKLFIGIVIGIFITVITFLKVLCGKLTIKNIKKICTLLWYMQDEDL